MSFKVCCVVGCMHRAPEHSLHKFPNPETEPERFKIWTHFSGVHREGIGDNSILNCRRICRSHFSVQFHYPANKLCRLAIPTLLPGGHYAPTTKKDSEILKPVDVEDVIESGDIPSRRHSLDSPILTKPSNASPIQKITADKPTESFPESLPSGRFEVSTLPERTCLKQDKTPRVIVLGDDPVTDKSGDAVVHGSITENEGDVSMYRDDDPLRPVAGARNDSSTDECYFCNVCKESINGFRYTCVQCEDWDLCGACEARAAHAAHYVLRIPNPRPYKEIQAVLTAIRQQLINGKLLPGKTDSVKEEPDSESSEATEPDPLDWDDDFFEEDTCNIQDGEHPPRKRHRPGSSITHSDQDLMTPESPKSTHDSTTDVHSNHDISKSAKEIQPIILSNENPTILKTGLYRLTGTTGTLLPTTALSDSRKTLVTLKPIPGLPLGMRDTTVRTSASLSIKEEGNHPKPHKLLHPGPWRSHSDQGLTTPKTPKLTRDSTTHVHSNLDVTKFAKDIQPRTLPNDNPTIPKVGLIRQKGPRTTGTPLPIRTLTIFRRKLTLKPVPRLPLGIRFIKKSLIVGSKLSKGKTAISFPSQDKSSSHLPDQATAVSSPTSTTLKKERAATSKLYARVLKGSSPADVVRTPKSEVSVRLKPNDDSKGKSPS